ncbi:STAS domain-containing protein [candidate division KSB1 bacterium]|nr:STAS domain-containing protein [candidate division KSB1 bacterium]
MEGIQLSVKHTGANNDISIIKVGGYIDTTTSAELEHSLESLIKAGRYNIIIDLGNVDYISSAGWGIFISEIKGIREKSGDLKLVNMIPDVYEVFELLEFHYILKAFDSIEDAIADFDKRKVYADDDKEPVGQTDFSVKSKVASKPATKDSTEDFFKKAKEPLVADQSVEDKIKQIVVENPDISSIKVMRELNTSRFGHVRLGYFQVLKYLKRLNLNSKKKRVEFFKKMDIS